jgi:hypothetical protein
MILQPATPKSGADPLGGREGEPGALPPKIGKDMIFLRKMVIFHTKYPKNFRASLRSTQFFEVRPPNLKSWIRPCPNTQIHDCSLSWLGTFDF